MLWVIRYHKCCLYLGSIPARIFTAKSLTLTSYDQFQSRRDSESSRLFGQVSAMSYRKSGLYATSELGISFLTA